MTDELDAMKRLAPLALLLAPVVIAYFELRVRPVWVRSCAERLATARKVGVTEADVAAAMREISGRKDVAA